MAAQNKEWFIYSDSSDTLVVASSLQEVYDYFIDVCGADEADLAHECFAVIKVISPTAPKPQSIKVSRTLKLV